MVKAVTVGKKRNKLYEGADFASCKPVLEPLKNKYTFDGEDEATINARIDDLEASSVYNYQPDYSLIRMVHRDKEDKIVKLTFSIRPKGTFRLVGVPVDVRGHFEILAEADFYSKFVDSLGDWFDFYNKVSFCTYNADILTQKMYEVANKAGITLPFGISFTLGEGIVEISNEAVVLGLSEEVLMHLDANPIMSDESDESAFKNMEAIIVNYMGYENFYDVVRTRNNLFAKTFGLSTRKLGTQVQRTSSKRLAVGKLGLNAHVSTITDDKENEAKYIALVNRVAVNAETAEQYKEQGAIITANVNMTKKQLEQNEEFVANTLHLNPVFYEGIAPTGFEKDLSGVTLEVILAEAGLI